jgi:hypothetical protein
MTVNAAPCEILGVEATGRVTCVCTTSGLHADRTSDRNGENEGFKVGLTCGNDKFIQYYVYGFTLMHITSHLLYCGDCWYCRCPGDTWRRRVAATAIRCSTSQQDDVDVGD